MRRLLIILTPFFFSCNNHLSGDYVRQAVDLKNNLGHFSIMLPPEMDTIYYWTNYSDYSCGDKAMFRFADSDYSLLQETGFIYKVRPDSLYDLTISQPKRTDCEDKDGKINNEFLDMVVQKQMAESPQAKIDIKEIRKIDDKDFVVIATTTKIKDKDNSALIAISTIDGQTIVITFRCFANNCNDFIHRMEKSLKTIKITTANNGYRS